jgi:hypothetical protein
MAKTSNKVEPGSYDELAKLLTLLAKRGTTRTALIYELADLNLEPKRIAELVGTTGNVVSVLLYQRKRGKLGKKARLTSELIATAPASK